MKNVLGISILMLLSGASLTLTSTAQQQPSASTEQSSQPKSSTSKTEPSHASEQQLSHASNEAAGRTPQESPNEPEDEEAAFKYSPAVRGIARITGLPLTAAYWSCVIINFAIIAVLIFLAMRSNIPAMLRGRTQEIQKGMEEARRASEDSSRRLREVDVRLSRLSLEIDEMQKHTEAEGKAEEDRIRASIEQEKHKIVQAAEQEIVQAANAARRDLQQYAVELAIALAEKRIRVDTATDKVLVEEFTDRLSAEPRRNGSG